MFEETLGALSFSYECRSIYNYKRPKIAIDQYLRDIVEFEFDIDRSHYFFITKHAFKKWWTYKKSGSALIMFFSIITERS